MKYEKKIPLRRVNLGNILTKSLRVNKITTKACKICNVMTVVLLYFVIHQALMSLTMWECIWISFFWCHFFGITNSLYNCAEVFVCMLVCVLFKKNSEKWINLLLLLFVLFIVRSSHLIYSLYHNLGDVRS